MDTMDSKQQRNPFARKFRESIRQKIAQLKEKLPPESTSVSSPTTSYYYPDSVFSDSVSTLPTEFFSSLQTRHEPSESELQSLVKEKLCYGDQESIRDALTDLRKDCRGGEFLIKAHLDTGLISHLAVSLYGEAAEQLPDDDIKQTPSTPPLPSTVPDTQLSNDAPTPLPMLFPSPPTTLRPLLSQNAPVFVPSSKIKSEQGWKLGERREISTNPFKLPPNLQLVNIDPSPLSQLSIFHPNPAKQTPPDQLRIENIVSTLKFISSFTGSGKYLTEIVDSPLFLVVLQSLILMNAARRTGRFKQSDMERMSTANLTIIYNLRNSKEEIKQKLIKQHTIGVLRECHDMLHENPKYLKILNDLIEQSETIPLIFYPTGNFTHKGHSVTLKKVQHTCLILSQPVTEGRWDLCVLFKNTSPKRMLGVADAKTVDLGKMTKLGDDSSSIGWHAKDGTIYINHHKEPTDMEWTEKHELHLLIDLNNHMIAFFRNGVIVPVIITNIPDSLHFAFYLFSESSGFEIRKIRRNSPLTIDLTNRGLRIFIFEFTSDVVLDEIFALCSYETLQSLKLVNRRFSVLTDNDSLYYKSVIDRVGEVQKSLFFTENSFFPISDYDPENEEHYRNPRQFGISSHGYKATLALYNSLKLKHSTSERIRQSIVTLKHRRKYFRVLDVVVYIILMILSGLATVGSGYSFQASLTHTRSIFLEYWMFPISCTCVALTLFSIYSAIRTRRKLLLLVLIPAVSILLPSFWLDGLFTSSIWFGCIPTSLLIVIGYPTICIILFIRKPRRYLVRAILISPFIASYFLALLKIDKTISLFWVIIHLPLLWSLCVTLTLILKRKREAATAILLAVIFMVPAAVIADFLPSYLNVVLIPLYGLFLLLVGFIGIKTILFLRYSEKETLSQLQLDLRKAPAEDKKRFVQELEQRLADEGKPFVAQYYSQPELF
ncbi:hypothetical protein BLNAU_13766 [Blattamonas nauphoetae]|uniref:SPRY domain-containing protein n=1 Tax=Blattamonas nauphoetae TaxID=2049346 RepID=A0ABQ9XKC4_9EUKA|nr:hypothetical protein BLNAU_13766 [Blattamonas nauphoetae]